MSSGPKVDKKSCYKCKYLEYVEKSHYESFDSNGYCCNKRSYKTTSEEYDHLDKLNDPGYLAKGKKCNENDTI